MLTSINEIFASITRVSGRSLRFELRPEVLNYNAYRQYYRYKIGFAITDSMMNPWPAPYRNLNDTGKLIMPNYGYPTLPETIGEFVQRIALEGDVETNSITFMIPGVADDVSTTLSVCVIDPADIELKVKPLYEFVNLELPA